jgi:hypothetical protein
MATSCLCGKVLPMIPKDWGGCGFISALIHCLSMS